MITGNWKLEIENSLARYLDSIVHFRFSLFEFLFSSFFTRVAAFVLAVAYPVAAYAQGCPLCYNTAAAAKASGIQALRSGILILVIPPLLICAGVVWRGIKARNLFNEPEPVAGVPEVARELAEMLAQTAPAVESWKIEEQKAKGARPAL